MFFLGPEFFLKRTFSFSLNSNPNLGIYICLRLSSNQGEFFFWKGKNSELREFWDWDFWIFSFKFGEIFHLGWEETWWKILITPNEDTKRRSYIENSISVWGLRVVFLASGLFSLYSEVLYQSHRLLNRVVVVRWSQKVTYPPLKSSYLFLLRVHSHRMLLI